MKASTELFLWEMLSIAESIFRPSFRFVDESFEGWAYRNGLLRQMQRLEKEAFLERQPGGSADRVYRLTPKGRLAALGGKDPEERWDRDWDGKWRLLMFDLPQSPEAPRRRFRRSLREHGLGCLQGSVWVSPDPLKPLWKQLHGDRHPSSLLLFEGTTVGGEKPREMVAEAWNFKEIEQVWSIYGAVLREGRTFLEGSSIHPEKLRDWTVLEHGKWKEVLEIDPLLPRPLLPRGYPGRKIWKERRRLWRRLAIHLRQCGFGGKSGLRQ